MKKILLAFALTISFLATAQVPQGISYQAIAMNGTIPVANGNVGIKLSVLNLTATGTAVYVETQTKTTNAQGLFNLVIGQGAPVTGTFAGINWGNGAKFLKVEMDTAGGTNYALVGTTQLLSAPYAMVAGGLVLAPGQGITLTSPNGTPYVLSVNDAGQLSLPNTIAPSTLPNNLYLTGSFNSFNPATSPLMGGMAGMFQAYKYLTAGSQIKFLASNTAGGTAYGLDGVYLVPNGVALNVPSSGFYYITTNYYDVDGTDILALDGMQSIGPQIYLQGDITAMLNSTYNPATNTFSFIANGLTTGAQIYFSYENPSGTNQLGDNLADGTVDVFGQPITGFPGLNATPKNYRIDLVINVNGSATYTITQI